MAFNSATYRMNQYRIEAWAALVEAREIRERVEAGTAYEWEVPRIATFAKLARINMHLHLTARRLRELERSIP